MANYPYAFPYRAQYPDRSPVETEKLERIWRQANQRFPSHKTLHPEITFAPSTELFRQMTSQPGWALASTQRHTDRAAAGGRAESEPEATPEIVLHEMLHVLVESEAGDRARFGCEKESSRSFPARLPPRWDMSTEAIDNALLNAASWSESERAHRAAGSSVHILAARYGMSTLRGWLTSGLPPGIAETFGAHDKGSDHRQ